MSNPGLHTHMHTYPEMGVLPFSPEEVSQDKKGNIVFVSSIKVSWNIDAFAGLLYVMSENSDT